MILILLPHNIMLLALLFCLLTLWCSGEDDAHGASWCSAIDLFPFSLLSSETTGKDICVGRFLTEPMNLPYSVVGLFWLHLSQLPKETKKHSPAVPRAECPSHASMLETWACPCLCLWHMIEQALSSRTLTELWDAASLHSQNHRII